ncbi:MAG: PaaI family thioesterase [Chitinophagales bacterium]
MTPSLEQVKYIVEKVIPLHKFLEVEVLEIEKGFVKMRIPFREEVLGNFVHRHWHGGMLSAMLDSAGGMVAGSCYPDVFDRISTIDIRVDYLRPAKDTAIIAEGKALRIGSRTVVTNMQIRQEGSEEVLAEGRGVFHIGQKK